MTATAAQKSFLERFRAQKQLHLMAIPLILYVILFNYVPIWGWTMAFQNYKPGKTFFAQDWAGLRWFVFLFTDSGFLRVLRNTIAMSFINMALGYVTAIVFALLLNEIRGTGFKRVVQTVSYLPHFLSWIIISGIAIQLFAPGGGIINMFLARLGLGPINFLMENNLWIGTYVALGVWKEMGWGTIIYLAAITGINPEVYEAAEVDGAGRWRKIWHVTLPGIRPTIVVLLIMNLGRILGSEFDRPYTLANPTVMQVADVIATLVYRVGIRSSQFSLTAAIGLFQSVICVIFLIAANAIAKKAGERGVW